MVAETTTIQDEYKRLQKGVSALHDASILRSPHFPHTHVGCIDATVTFCISEHEDPREMGGRILGALHEAQRLLDESIKQLTKNMGVTNNGTD